MFMQSESACVQRPSWLWINGCHERWHCARFMVNREPCGSRCWTMSKDHRHEMLLDVAQGSCRGRNQQHTDLRASAKETGFVNPS